MRKSTKRLIAVAATTVVLLGGAGIAYAYWTAGGTGTGTGSTGTSEAIIVDQDSTPTNIRPGGDPQLLSGDFINANDEPVYVGTVTASIASISGGGPTCEATDYALANAVMTVNAQVPPGTDVGAWSGATIAFNNKPAENQDDCKNATVNFSYTAN
jgi:hypothetical protein